MKDLPSHKESLEGRRCKRDGTIAVKADSRSTSASSPCRPVRNEDEPGIVSGKMASQRRSSLGPTWLVRLSSCACFLIKT